MVKINQVLKLLSAMNPNANQARLCFHNYLSYFCDHDDTLCPEILEDFFAHALDYVHWIQNRNILSQEIKNILAQTNTLGQFEFDFSQIIWPQEMQVIEVESTRSWVEILQNYLKANTSSEQKFRLVHDDHAKKILAFVLNPDGTLMIRQFDRKFCLADGGLIPLRRNISLFYNSEMELDVTHKQRLEVAPFVTAQFRVMGEKITGGLLRGYLAQKFFELRGEPLAAYPKLFYSVKRIESFFIDRRSDTFYLGLVQELERTNALVRVNDPEAIQNSVAVLTQSHNALENVFIGDKLLSLLIRDLQNNLGNRRVGQNTGPNSETSEANPSWNNSQISPQNRPRTTPPSGKTMLATEL